MNRCFVDAAGNGGQLSEAQVQKRWNDLISDLQYVCFTDEGTLCGPNAKPYADHNTFISFPDESNNVCVSQCQAGKSICDLSDHTPGSCGQQMDLCKKVCGVN